jgi:hypothetical protein
MKGQSISLDLLFGIFIFLVIFTYLLVTITEYTTRYSGNSVALGMELSAISASNALLMGGGVPYNWSLDTPPYSRVDSVGIAGMPRVIDPAKMAALQSMANQSYEAAKRSLGIENDFLITVEAFDGFQHATIGQQASNASSAVEIERIATLRGKPVIIRVRVYGDE